MKKFNKNKILNRILYLIFILSIILSSVYIAKSFVSKKEAEKERDLLNSIDVDDVEEIEEKYKNSKTNDGNNNESEKQKNDNKKIQNEDNINNEENQKSQEKSAEEIRKENEAESIKRIIPRPVNFQILIQIGHFFCNLINSFAAKELLIIFFQIDGR